MKKLKNFVEGLTEEEILEYRTKKTPAAANVDPEKIEGKPAEKNGTGGRWSIDEPKDDDAISDIDLKRLYKVP